MFAIFAIEQRLPRFVVENSPNLGTVHDGRLLRRVLARLREAGYFVAWKVLSTKDVGDIPQFRERLFIVAIRTAAGAVADFYRPEIISMMQLEQLLPPKHAETFPDMHMPKGLAAEHAANAKRHARDTGLEGDRCVADYLSKRFCADAKPSLWTPAQQHSKTRGCWLGSRHRCITASEAAWLQGHPQIASVVPA